MTSEDTEELAVDLLDQLLVLEPSRRLTAEKMLDHEYFWTEPLPRKAANPAPLLPQNVSCHEFETKQNAKKRHHEGGSEGSKRHRAPASPVGRRRPSVGRDGDRPRMDEHGELIRDGALSSRARTSADGRRKSDVTQP